MLAVLVFLSSRTFDSCKWDQYLFFLRDITLVFYRRKNENVVAQNMPINIQIFSNDCKKWMYLCCIIFLEVECWENQFQHTMVRNVTCSILVSGKKYKYTIKLYALYFSVTETTVFACKFSVSYILYNMCCRH